MHDLVNKKGVCVWGGGSLIYLDTKKNVIGEDKITACLIYEDVRHKYKSSTKVYL